MVNLVQPQPKGFNTHSFDLKIEVPYSVAEVWDWLNTPETFTETQIFPYKVEFYSPDPVNIPNGFNEGVLNIHYGPLINFAGVLTEIRPMKYRDLQYYYGSYALSIRWVRPYRLEFWLDPSTEGTTVQMKVSSYVKPGISKLWTVLQRLFWSRFKGFMTSGVKKNLKLKKVA